MEVSSIIKWTVLATITFILSLNGYLLLTYFHLQSSHPLENFRGGFITPISLTTDETIVGTGLYDRHVLCKLTNFDIHLFNTETSDEIVIGPKSLAKVPPAHLKPGNDIPIEFEVYIPKTIYPGRWKPTYHGEYICQEGIFQEAKSVHLELSVLTVVE